MRTTWILGFGVAVLSLGLFGQSQSQPVPGSPEKGAGLGTGLGFEAVLTRTLDVRKARAGDAVLARVAEEFRLPDGRVIPKNAKLIGHLTAVQLKGRGASDSRIGLTFDKVAVRDGREVPIQALIQSVSATEDSVPGGVPRSSFEPSQGSNSKKKLQIDSAFPDGTAISILRSSTDNLRVESGAHLALSVIQQ